MDKSTFVYIEPKTPTHNFAQCATCKMFLADHGVCSLLGKNQKITATMACNMYVPGGPAQESEMEHVSAAFTPKEVGLVNTKVRCENCEYFNEEESECLLMEILGIADHTVDAHGCCNAFHSDKDKTEKSEKRKNVLKRFVR